MKNEQKFMCTPAAFPAMTVGIIKPETWTLLLTRLVSHQTPDRTDLHPVWGTHPLHSTPISLPLFPQLFFAQTDVKASKWVSLTSKSFLSNPPPQSLQNSNYSISLLEILFWCLTFAWLAVNIAIA